MGSSDNFSTVLLERVGNCARDVTSTRTCKKSHCWGWCEFRLKILISPPVDQMITHKSLEMRVEVFCWRVVYIGETSRKLMLNFSCKFADYRIRVLGCWTLNGYVGMAEMEDITRATS